MSTQKNLYEVLGISKTASQDEIKKVYKKLAMKWHPDRHAGKSTEKEAQKKFPEIQAAYNTLSDPKQKEAYDMELNYGGQRQSQGPKGWGNSHQSSGFEDFFRDAFNQQRQRQSSIGLKVPFHMADAGGTFQYGHGKNITLEPGTPDGAQLISNNEHIVITLDYPNDIQRQNDDIYIEVELPILHSILGCKMRFEHWTGKTFEVEWPSSTVTGKKLRLKGQGARKYKSASRGDLYLIATVTANPPLNKQILESLRKATGTPSILKTNPKWN